MPVEAVLFDLYGTLVDVEVDEEATEVWLSLADLLKGWGVATQPEELRTRFRQLSVEAGVSHGEGFILPGVFARLLEQCGAPADPHAVETFAQTFRRASTINLSLRPYTYALLLRLRDRGFRLGLVSNTEGILTHHDLDRLGIEGLFDAILLSSEVGAEKPSPEIFRAALQRLRVAPSSAVMVGDGWATDICGAELAGLPAVYLDESLAPGEFVRVSDRALVRAHPDEVAIEAALKALGVLS